MPISSAIDRPGVSKPERDRQGGFTLMEVVLAMTIIAMLAALGLPFLRPNTGVAALRMKTFEIAALLRADRNLALRSGKTSTVLISPDRGVIQSTASTARIDMPATLSLQLLPKGTGGIQFFADGRASAARLVIRAGKIANTIDVNGLTATVNTSEALQ